MKTFSNPAMAKLLQKNARDSVDRFSDETFAVEIIEALRSLPSLRKLIRANTVDSSSSNDPNPSVSERKRRNSDVKGVVKPHR